MTTKRGASVSTGVPGLDHVLDGGLPAHRVHLLQGDPGVGKTTVALQFLIEGRRLGEKVLYVTLSETREELEAAAASHGWDLSGIDIYEMGVGDMRDEEDEAENSLYVPGEVELGERMTRLRAVVDRTQPRRIVVDSSTELRLLAQSPLRFRRQILALKEDLVKRECTVLLIENPTSAGGDPLLQSLVHSVIVLEQLWQQYGASRRRLRVHKMREVAFRGGYHDVTIETAGVVVHPRLVAAEHRQRFDPKPASSGIAGIDALLGGGIDRGTTTMFIGPAGSGKSALAAQYSVAAARRGERVAMFTFDEGSATLFARARGLGLDLERFVDEKLITVQQIDPAELSPGEFVGVIRAAVEVSDARVIVIDSLNGYLHAMPEEHFLAAQLHELFAYLRQHGVVAIMIAAQHGIVGGSMASPIDLSYLADNVVLFRYFEAQGRVRKALAAIKKRSGPHEDTIREFSLGPTGFAVGEPLTGFQGVLTGVPEVMGGAAATLTDGRH